MPDWKIMIADGLDESGQSILQAEAQVDDRTGITADALKSQISAYDGLIVRGRTRVTADVLVTAKRLQVVGRAGVGVDNIDLAAATGHDVIVVNAPRSTTLAVAEHTLALLLALARSIPQADAGMKTGHWLKKDLMGVELHGKVLGIIGVGNIGGQVARHAQALGMQVLGYDAVLSGADIQLHGVEPVELGYLYANSDFISLHVPLLPETRKMITGQTFGLMKKGVCLVCTARGGLIDETALLGALESGQVAGAALDVFANEPPGLTALVSHPHVIATPHIGAQTIEAQKRAAQDIAHEVMAALRGDPLRWRVV